MIYELSKPIILFSAFFCLFSTYVAVGARSIIGNIPFVSTFIIPIFTILVPFVILFAVLLNLYIFKTTFL